MKNVVITISRCCGGGGTPIGQGIAKELGIDFIDRELIRMASDDSGISEELFAKVDERLNNNPINKITRNIYHGQLLSPGDDNFTSTDNLFNYQAKVLKELAAKQSFIVIGRCADYILKDFDNVVRVFVHAPMRNCIENMREVYPGVSDRELEKRIKKTDIYRSNYYTYHTGREWQNARHFDLCLNSGALGYEKCIRLVSEYVKIKLGDI